MNRYKKHISINIRNLAEITFPDGSLGNEADGGLSAQLGIEIHKRYQNRGIDNYRDEVPFSKTFEGELTILEVSGKADGMYEAEACIHIEEIKTMTSDLENFNNGQSVHLAQLKFYGFFYLLDNNNQNIMLDLIYFNRKNSTEKIFSAKYSIKELESECLPWINNYIKWCDEDRKHEISLKSDLKKLEFPFTKFREGQYEFSKAVYCTIREKKLLFAEAPTGTGKTAAVIYPTLKAMSENLTEKIFYLTAKNAGAQTAEKTAAIFSSMTENLRWISITAKAKICFMNENSQQKPDCSPEKCRYALDYYKRLPAAINTVFTVSSFPRIKIEEIAENFVLCPYELSLDISLFCELIIADYNYAFDFSSRLKRFFSKGKTSYTILVDEAHNFIDRARNMFSAEISKQHITDIKKISLPQFKKNISEIGKEFSNIKRSVNPLKEVCEISSPLSLIKAVSRCLDEMNSYIEKNGKLPLEFSDFYWNLQNFITVSEHYSQSYRTVIKITSKNISVRLACIDPSDEIQAVLKNQKAAVFFSATLSPYAYYRNLISPELDSYSLTLNSPFNPDNCLHVIKADLSTRYNTRVKNGAEYASIVRNIFQKIKGNIAVFSPSFAFQNQLLSDLGIENSEINSGSITDSDLVIQNAQMSNSEKDVFLNKFHESRNLKAFCVLGGSFSESIDLPGDKLIGVIIFGVGLPQINFDNNVIKDFFENQSGNGFAFAYMYPGFNRVLQAAGRVIRTENDRGFVILIDDRYNSGEYRKLIPAHWNLKRFDRNSIIDAILKTINTV